MPKDTPHASPRHQQFSTTNPASNSGGEQSLPPFMPARDEEGYRHRSRASSRSSTRSEKFVMPMSAGGMAVDPERLTPSVDLDDDRMSIASSTAKSARNTQRYEGFEKECSYHHLERNSPSLHIENKLDLAMVPVISDQLLYDIVNKERSIEQIDVHLFVKKSLDLLSAKNSAELRVDQLKAKLAELEVENRNIRESKVRMQVRVEQEEEYISNMLLKRIQKLKTDKELLALKYEQEEEFLTNDLMRKLVQLEGERDELAARLSNDQSWVVSNLLQKIRKLETEIQSNQKSLEQLRREKVDLENSLEHEQEALFNTLGKRMDQLEAEKRRLQVKLDESEAARVAGGGVGATIPSIASETRQEPKGSGGSPDVAQSTTRGGTAVASESSGGEPSPVASIRSALRSGHSTGRGSMTSSSLNASVSSLSGTSGIGSERTNSTTE